MTFGAKKKALLAVVRGAKYFECNIMLSSNLSAFAFAKLKLAPCNKLLCCRLSRRHRVKSLSLS